MRHWPEMLQPPQLGHIEKVIFGNVFHTLEAMMPAKPVSIARLAIATIS
jgi:hypothetical protein